jgi:hypothetical protein
MAKTTYYAQWNGETFTRTTARTYTHAAVYRNADGAEYAGSFHGSAALAAKGVDGRKPIAVVEVSTTPDATPAPVVEVEAEVMCPNTGVVNPKRVMSKCVDCGKEGTVNRGTGRLRAHKPMNTPKPAEIKEAPMANVPSLTVQITAELAGSLKRSKLNLSDVISATQVEVEGGTGVRILADDELRGPVSITLDEDAARWLRACFAGMEWAD